MMSTMHIILVEAIDQRCGTLLEDDKDVWSERKPKKGYWLEVWSE